MLSYALAEINDIYLTLFQIQSSTTSSTIVNNNLVPPQQEQAVAAQQLQQLKAAPPQQQVWPLYLNLFLLFHSKGYH